MSDFVIGTTTAAKSGSTVLVSVAGTVTLCQAPRDLALGAGDPVAVLKQDSVWYVVQRYETAAPAADTDELSPPPDPKPTTVTGTLVVSPVETRSYRNSKWRTDNDDVYQGEYGGQGNHTGAVFYGSKPLSLDGATVTDAYIKVRRPDKGGANAAQATTMRLVSQRTRPGGAPTLGSTTSGPSLRRGQTTSAFDIPVSWAQAMVDGTAGGLAFYESGGSPYVIFSGRGDWSSAFALTIKWRRTN